MRIFIPAIAALVFGACASVPNTYAERMAQQGCHASAAADQRASMRASSLTPQVTAGYNKVCWPVSSTWYGADDSRDQQRSNLATQFPSEDPV